MNDSEVIYKWFFWFLSDFHDSWVILNNSQVTFMVLNGSHDSWAKLMIHGYFQAILLILDDSYESQWFSSNSCDYHDSWVILMIFNHSVHSCVIHVNPHESTQILYDIKRITLILSKYIWYVRVCHDSHDDMHELHSYVLMIHMNCRQYYSMHDPIFSNIW